MKGCFSNLLLPGVRVLQGSLVGYLPAMVFIIQGFSKQCKNLCHWRVTIVCLSLSSAGIHGVNKTGHHGGGCSLAIFAVLVLCGLCQYVFISLLREHVFLFSIQGNVWLSKSGTFSPVLSQKKEQRES